MERGGELGALLREWRARRGRSQLALAVEAGMSQRHLSFIESGRAAPSRPKLLQIARTLDIPLRERNALFLAAGYAPVYPDGAWDEPAMAVVAGAIRRVLKQQEPFPALLMDRAWNVLETNAAAPRFFGSFVDLAAWPRPRNLLELMFSPAGLRPFVHDWERAAATLIGRVRREAVGHVVDDRTRALLASLAAQLGREVAPVDDGSPVTSISFRRDGCVLNYFSLVSTIGTPATIAAQELRVECMFPSDEATDRIHRQDFGMV